MDDFFRQWHTYRTIVTEGYMGHKDIADCILAPLQRIPGDLQILDLGCGDAEVMFNLFPEVPVSSYKGVDSSAAALELLSDRFQGKHVASQLYCQDIMDFLPSCRDQFDVIIAGFCMHHLSSDKKKRCLQMAYHCLRENGLLFIYDVFLQPGESREQYLVNYLAHMHSSWQAMSSRELKALDAHITGCDFPEEVESYQLWADKLGFAQVNQLWEGEWHSHKLLQLTRF